MENNNHLKIRKSITVGVIVCALILIGFLGSYAFFIGQVGQNEKQSVTIETGNIELIFSDGKPFISEPLNFGENAIKTFTIENTGTLDAAVNMNFDELTNSYLYNSLTYRLSYSDSEDGEYETIVDNRNIFTSDTPISQTLASNLFIPAKTKYYYKLEITLNDLKDIDQTKDLSAMLSTNFKLIEGTENIVEKIKASAHSVNETPNFASVATTDEGVYQMEDDYGISYYFRGAVENNYVKFADFYWRIIRVNGDGTLRLIYDGTEAHANGESSEDRVAIQNIKWNDEPIFDPKYLGYMYGGQLGESSTSYEQAIRNETDSNAKKELDNWFENNISIYLRQFISDNIFCNDRSLSFTSDCNTTGYGYPTLGGHCHGSRERIYMTSPQSPLLSCPQKNDAFTVNNDSGNAALKYPVGLITADEVALAGTTGYFNANSNFYLYKGVTYWSMSPSGCNKKNGSSVSDISSLGELVSRSIESYISNTNALVPVINLSQEYIETMTGSGTITDPYHGIYETI